MNGARVTGVGLFTPGFAGPEAWCRGVPEPEVERAEAPSLAGPLRRRASPLTRMAVDALDQAIAAAGCDGATLPTVWATAHGEHENAVAILDMMHRGEGKLSPTRFHNSVYNTASGYASIAAGNRALSTTLSGGRDLVATALLEAFALLAGGAPEAAVVLFDEPLRPPFDDHGAREPLALALCLAGGDGPGLAHLSPPRLEPEPAVKRHERFGGLYLSAALPLLERIVAGRPGLVPLELEGGPPGPVWCAELRRLDGASA